MMTAVFSGLFAGLMFGLNVSPSAELLRSRKKRRRVMYGVRTHASPDAALASDYQRVFDSFAAKFGCHDQRS